VNVTNPGKKKTRFIRAKLEHAATQTECKDEPTHKCTSHFTKQNKKKKKKKKKPARQETIRLMFVTIYSENQDVFV